MREAMFWHIKNEGIVCDLCPNRSHILEGQSGLCRVRSVKNQCLYTNNYGMASALNVDPIEKKPLYYFLEGTKTLSYGSYGCNFHCTFCQNYDIAHLNPVLEYISPEDLVRVCIEKELPSISYTYNEPTISYEYVYDASRISHDYGIKNILVTNGFISKEPLRQILPYIDAANIDVKAHDNEVYKKFCGGNLESVLETLDILKEKHIECTFLIVPGVNDDIIKLEGIFKKLKGIKKEIPIHINRYFPRYQYKEPMTEKQIMIQIYNCAKTYFDNVHLGNI